MSEQPLRLLRHGEYVSPIHEPLPPGMEHLEPGHGKARRIYLKHEQAHEHGAALGWIKATYQDAIEYTTRVESMRGMAFAGVFFVGPLFASLSILLISAFDFSKYGISAGIAGVFLMVGGLLGLVFTTGLTSFLLRSDLFHSEDMPLIFDRKNRRVYRLFREVPSSLWAVFLPWPTKACMYNWDLVEARRESELIVSPAVPSVDHHLMLYVRKSEKDPTIIDSFNVGSAMDLNEGLADAMWEHIRRFMEEGGPHLPTPDEPLARQNPPASWWQSLGATGFIGQGYWGRWAKQPSAMILLHLIFPLTVPLFLLWGTGNWLSHKTEVKVHWPKTVLAAIGPRAR